MTQYITSQGISNPQSVGMTDLTQKIDQAFKAQGQTVPGFTDTVKDLMSQIGNQSLPILEEPTVSGKSKNLSSLNLGGLSMETLMDAVGMLQRQTETTVGKSNMAARAEERSKVNAEKLEKVKEEVDNAKSKGVLDGLLKAFKYIGMVLAAIGSIAMIVVGSVGLAAGGSGAALIAVGVAAFAMLVDSIVQEATDGKVGIGPGYIVGKIAEACGASESAVMWIKFGVDLAASIAMCVAGGFAAAGSIGSAGANAAAKGTEAIAGTLKSVTKVVSTVANVTNTAMTIAKSGVSIAVAVQERDTAFSQAEQRRLQAILERIAIANDLDLDHLKAMMQRSEETLQMVGEIVKQSVETNMAIMTGSPSMA